MGITPTTEAIELIRYAVTKGKKPVETEDGTVREWSHPNTGAPGVVIVDTPGTGSVFEKHERIAKGFLSRSDLVIFLVSAKRAFAQTEKLYLELAKNYGKKIILVVNQIDLLEEKRTARCAEFRKTTSFRTLNITPPMFPISAKEALKGSKSGGLFSGIAASDDSAGMDKVKAHLLETFKQTPPAKQKLYAQLDFADSITSKYLGELQKRLDLVVDDERQAKQLREELEKQAESLNEQLKTSMKELDKVFDTLRGRGASLSANTCHSLAHVCYAVQIKMMSARNLRKMFVGSSLQQINDISEDYVNAVIDGSRRYWRSIIERLNKIETLLKEQVASLLMQVAIPSNALLYKKLLQLRILNSNPTQMTTLPRACKRHFLATCPALHSVLWGLWAESLPLPLVLAFRAAWRLQSVVWHSAYLPDQLC